MKQPKRMITAIKNEYFCPHCNQKLTPMPDVPKSIVQNGYFWIQDGASRIKCCTCNNVVRA